jgi:hypothetical protein
MIVFYLLKDDSLVVIQISAEQIPFCLRKRFSIALLHIQTQKPSVRAIPMTDQFSAKSRGALIADRRFRRPIHRQGQEAGNITKKRIAGSRFG